MKNDQPASSFSLKIVFVNAHLYEEWRPRGSKHQTTSSVRRITFFPKFWVLQSVYINKKNFKLGFFFFTMCFCCWNQYSLLEFFSFTCHRFLSSLVISLLSVSSTTILLTWGPNSLSISSNVVSVSSTVSWSRAAIMTKGSDTLPRWVRIWATAEDNEGKKPRLSRNLKNIF